MVLPRDQPDFNTTSVPLFFSLPKSPCHLTMIDPPSTVSYKNKEREKELQRFSQPWKQMF